MNTRRLFITRLSSAVAGCYLALGTKLGEAVNLQHETAWIINPDYVNAEYIVHFWLGEDSYSKIELGPAPILDEKTRIIYK